MRARRHEVRAAAAEQNTAAEEQQAMQDRMTREVWHPYVDYQAAAEQRHLAQSYLALLRPRISPLSMLSS